MKLSLVLSLCGSLALGGAALLVARVWLPSGTPEAEAAPAPVNTVPVVVASHGLAYGARLEAGNLAIRQIPSDAVPEGAFSTIEAVLAQDEGGPLALAALSPREVILPTRISGPGSRPSVAVQIREGMRAYAIAVTDQSGVGGNALPGDWVDVILARETNPDRPDRGLVSEVVLQNVRVLGLDLNADPNSTDTAVARTATLEVALPDVQKLALSSQLGTLSLALRRTGQAETDAVRTVRATDVSTAGGYAPVRAASPAPGASRTAARAVPPPPPPPPPGRTITIVSGGEASLVSVPQDRIAQGNAG